MKHNLFITLFFCAFISLSYSQEKHLTIKGDTVFETKVIDSIGYNKTHQDLNTIKTEAEQTKERLIKAGYINVISDSIQQIEAHTYLVNFKLNQKIETIHIYIDSQLINEAELKLISKTIKNNYFVLPFYKIEETLDLLNSNLASNGDPFHKLHLNNITSINDKTLKANLVLDSTSEKRTLDNIILKGYENFPKSFLKHYLKIKPNTVFNINTINKKIENLNTLPFANALRAPEVLFTKDSTTLYIYTEKQKSNNFDGFIGFSTDENSKLKLNGYLNLNLNNALNYGEAINLSYKSDASEQKTFNINTRLPYLFKSPIGLELNLNIFKKDSTYNNINQSAKLFYQLNANTKLFAGVLSSSSNVTNESSTSLKDFKTTSYSLNIEYLKPNLKNNIIRNKTYALAGFNLGSKKAITTSKQQSASLKAFHSFNLNTKNSIFLKVEGYKLFSNNIFENELLQFGGINSIRGFSENSLFASEFGTLNTEYRYFLSPNLYMHSVIDVGYFKNDIIKQGYTLYGYGFGFGLNTNAGLLKFVYANGKTNEDTFKLSNSKIHLSLSALF